MRMKKFNVQSKTSLVYCTNRTKRLMGKIKIKPFSSSESVKAVQLMGWVYCGKDFWKSFEFRVEKSRSGDRRMSLDILHILNVFYILIFPKVQDFILLFLL